MSNKAIPLADAEDSTGGLGGYHGSAHVGNATVYYAVGVYSERLANGGTNGIPVFPANWKNMVATFYHELQEARTDVDVDDAATSPNGMAVLRWTSDSGNEIGDYPIAEAKALAQVFRRFHSRMVVEPYPYNLSTRTPFTAPRVRSIILTEWNRHRGPRLHRIIRHRKTILRAVLHRRSVHYQQTCLRKLAN